MHEEQMINVSNTNVFTKQKVPFCYKRKEEHEEVMHDCTQKPRKATERNANTTKQNANATKRQSDETKETLCERFLNASATKWKRRLTQK